MEPNTAQPGAAVQPQVTPTQSQSQGQSLDPSVLALTKSIGLAESGGNYGAGDNTGDGANSAGAYQMTPAFIENWAPKEGIQYTPGQPLSMAQQNELAYKTIQTLGTTGDPNDPSLGKLSPAQIASYWNTNDPNAYLDPNYGKNNTYGSTANYVDAVEKSYSSEMGQSASNPLVPSADASGGSSDTSSSGSGPSWTDVLLGGATGLGAWLAGQAQKPLQDAATDAAVGATVGSILPGEGTVAGGVAGAIGGTIQGIVQDVTGSGSTPAAEPAGSSATPDDNATDTASLEPPQASGATKQTPTPPTEPKPQPVPTPNNTVLDEENAATNANSKNVSQAVIQDYSSTVGGRKAMNDPNVMGGIEEIGMNGWGPDVVKNENGDHINDYSEGIEKAKNMIGETSGHMTDMLHASGGIGSMQDTLSDAEQDFGQTRGIDASERKMAKEYMASKGKDYLAENGDGRGNMSVGHFQKMKQELGEGKKWDQTEANWKREADKSLSRAARRQVEKSVPKEAKELYNRANKKMQRMINAKHVMEKLDKKKGKKNSSAWKKALEAGGKYAALYIGDKIGGPLGAILGSMVGDYVTRAADKKFGKTVFETPAMMTGLKILQGKNPKAYDVLQNELKKAGIVTPKELKALPAPSFVAGQKPRQEQEPAIVTQSKTPPKDYATAKNMKSGRSQYGSLYEYNKGIKLTRGLINPSPKHK